MTSYCCYDMTMCIEQMHVVLRCQLREHMLTRRASAESCSTSFVFSLRPSSRLGRPRAISVFRCCDVVFLAVAVRLLLAAGSFHLKHSALPGFAVMWCLCGQFPELQSAPAIDMFPAWPGVLKVHVIYEIPSRGTVYFC